MVAYQGYVFVSELSNNIIRKMTCDLIAMPSIPPTPAPSTRVPTSTASPTTPFVNPNSCVVDAFAGVQRTSALILYKGDGGQATSASFSNQAGLWINPTSQDLYIADQYSYRARKVNLNSRVITTFAGVGASSPSNAAYSGPATSAVLGPYHVCGDTIGSIYIVERSNYVVRKVGTDGILSTFAGTGDFTGDLGIDGPATSATLASMYHCVVDFIGEVYLTFTNKHFVRTVDFVGNLVAFAGTGVNTPAGLSGGALTSTPLAYPDNMFIDSVGNMFITELSARVRKTVLGSNILTTYAGE